MAMPGGMPHLYSKAQNGAESRLGMVTATMGSGEGWRAAACASPTTRDGLSDKGPLLKAVRKEALVAEQACVLGSQLTVACLRPSSSKTCAGSTSAPQHLQSPDCVSHPAALGIHPRGRYHGTFGMSLYKAHTTGG